MGLDAYTKERGENNFRILFQCGYIRYAYLLKKIVYAYNKELGKIFSELVDSGECATNEQVKKWNKLCDDDLDLLLLHSDCGGKFTPKECSEIYSAIKDIKIDIGENEMWCLELFENIKEAFNHCRKKRVNLYYG